MTGMARYYLDTPRAGEADSEHPTRQPSFYTFVIRKLGSPGWIFRFTDGDRRGAQETLANLNWERTVG